MKTGKTLAKLASTMEAAGYKRQQAVSLVARSAGLTPKSNAKKPYQSLHEDAGQRRTKEEDL